MTTPHDYPHTQLLIDGQWCDAEGGKTITYWSMWESTEPQGQVIQKAVDAYMAESGNKVDLQFKGRTGIREGLHLVSVQHVAAIRENLPVGVFVMQRGMGAGEAIRIAATEGHFCPLAQQQA